MRWLNWNNTLINLRFVKSLYIHEWSSDEEKKRPARWAITISMFDKEGKYDRHFESKEEAYAEFNKIKKELGTF